MPKTSKKKQVQQLDDFISAVEFIGLAQRETGSEYETHCKIKDGYMTGFDGVLAAGCPIAEDLSGCPNTHTLTKAMKQCKGADVFTLSQTLDRLVVKANGFRASVPCIALGFDSIPESVPDPIYVNVPDGYDSSMTIDAFTKAFSLISERSPNLHLCSVGMSPYGTALGTNGTAIVEAYHGLPLSDVALPYRFVDAFLKVHRPITAIGMSERSVTFYFRGNWWLKSQLMDGDYPLTRSDAIIDKAHARAEFAEWMRWRMEMPLLTTYLSQVGLFSKDDFVCLQGDTVSVGETARVSTEGPYFPASERHIDWIIANKLLNMFEQVNFTAHEGFVLFRNQFSRAVLQYASHS